MYENSSPTSLMVLRFKFKKESLELDAKCYLRLFFTYREEEKDIKNNSH